MKMKDKRAKDKADKEAHKLELLNAKRKRRGEEPLLTRSKATIKKKPLILIACEGKNTEPSYFKQFRLSSVQVEPKGEGYSHLSLVDWAQELSKLKSYDEVWIVFDADPKPDNPKWKDNFNNAFWKAKGLNYQVGYSHQAFEYWLLLHFENHQGGSMDRSAYNKKLNNYLNKFGVQYDGSGTKKIEADFFELLQGIDEQEGKSRQDLAICRAKKILDKYDQINPADQESSTSVHQLVLRLINIENNTELTEAEFCNKPI